MFLFSRIVPLGVKSWLKARNITNCIELDWWESHEVKSFDISTGKNESVKFVFTPTKHWTSRTPFDKNSCLWGSYVVRSPTSRFFFTGDTAYCDIFRKIGELYGPFDLAAIPIGAYKPRYAMSQVHCDPDESIMIAQDLRCKKAVGIHWGTFPLADEFPMEPALELSRARDARGLPLSFFHTMQPGETIDLKTEATSDYSSMNPALYTWYLQRHQLDKDKESRLSRA
jgi:N-acyl-phosphatidylethanolamine-hydrolysing phospholipase D